MPVMAKVDNSGRRPVFAVEFSKPAVEVKWQAKFTIKDATFGMLKEKYSEASYRMVWHERYRINKKFYHAAIWHFDALADPYRGGKHKDGRPADQPLSTIWDGTTTVPSHGKAWPMMGLVDQNIQLFLQKNQLPGVSVAFMKNQQLIYQRAFGYAHLERKTPLRIEHSMRLGRVSYLITAVAALQLIDQGKLRLEDKVMEILEDAKPWKPAKADPRLKDITILHLLQQSSGFAEKPERITAKTTAWLASEMKTPRLSKDQYLSYILIDPLDFAPGSKSQECRFGYFVLGRVIEKISGKTYEDYVKEHIAKPLKMNTLALLPVDLEKRDPKKFASCYERAGTFVKSTVAGDADAWVKLGDGGEHLELGDSSIGWCASPTDMLKLISAVSSSREGFLSEETRRYLINPPTHGNFREENNKLVWFSASMRCFKKNGRITTYNSSDHKCFVTSLSTTSDIAFCFSINCGHTPQDKLWPFKFNATFEKTIDQLLNR